jgi:hypothetical protein
MKVTREEAQKSLEDIQLVMARMRRTIAIGGTPYYMILWGAVWFLGYLASHFIHSVLQGWIWVSLVVVGTVLSAYLGFRSGVQVRMQRVAEPWLLAIAIVGYGALWLWVAQPKTPEQISLLIVTFTMFGYVIMGLLVERTAAWVGLLVTFLALVGYYLLREYFNLWMAFLGGGTLMASGAFIMRKWR